MTNIVVKNITNILNKKNSSVVHLKGSLGARTIPRSRRIQRRSAPQEGTIKKVKKKEHRSTMNKVKRYIVRY